MVTIDGYQDVPANNETALMQACPPNCQPLIFWPGKCAVLRAQAVMRCTLQPDQRHLSIQAQAACVCTRTGLTSSSGQ